MKYSLEIIPGTSEFVEKELLEKFPDAKIINVSKKSLDFESEMQDVDSFRSLFSPLRITKENGLIRNLFRREWRVEVVPAGVNPSLAYIMCTLGEINESDVVYDPFCGGGTIIISAAKYFNCAKALASDISGKAVDITLKNFGRARIDKNKYSVFRTSITQVRIQDGYVDAIITNLPFGIRVGDHDDNLEIYKAFAKVCKRVLKEYGRIVILTQEKDLLMSVMSQAGFKLRKRVQVEVGGLKPDIFVYASN